jgi:hypothetical protein
MNDLIKYLSESLLFISNPKKYWYYAPKAIAAYFSDRYAANYVFNHIAGRKPQNGEKTISDMLENLCCETDHPDHKFFWEMSLMINRRCPTNDHIKVVI